MAIRELDLEKSLNDYLIRNEETEEEKFVVNDDAKADWALRKIREAEARVEQIKGFAAERISEIEEWVETATKRETHSITYLTGLLEAYHRNEFAKNPRLKTIKLPAGQLQLRKATTQFSRDNERLTQWLKEHRPEFVKIQESPNWAEAKKAFEVQGRHLLDPVTGVIVDGVEVYEPEQETFRVRTRKGGVE